jgi:hypothetical protein
MGESVSTEVALPVLAVKAKLISVADGIETFEEAFMAHVVMPDGRTVAETITPAKGAGRSEAGHRKQ